MTTVSKIEVKNVFKIFGARSKEALALIGQGKTKDQVLAETGCVVGVNDLSLSIGTGEIFVIMGLSGSGKSTLVRHFNRLIDPTSGAILVDGEDKEILVLECSRDQIQAVLEWQSATDEVVEFEDLLLHLVRKQNPTGESQ